MSCNLKPFFFECRTVVPGLLKLNFKARQELQDIPEFLSSNLSWIHIVVLVLLDINWS